MKQFKVINNWSEGVGHILKIGTIVTLIKNVDDYPKIKFSAYECIVNGKTIKQFIHPNDLEEIKQKGENKMSKQVNQSKILGMFTDAGIYCNMMDLRKSTVIVAEKEVYDCIYIVQITLIKEKIIINHTKLDSENGISYASSSNQDAELRHLQSLINKMTEED